MKNILKITPCYVNIVFIVNVPFLKKSDAFAYFIQFLARLCNSLFSLK